MAPTALNREERSADKKPQPDYEVVVIGGGFSGIGAGIKLKKAGIHSFTILERGEDVGGVWNFNTYPGIAVDISSFSYSFSFEQNPNWSRMFAPGKELKAYADHCVDKYELHEHFKFNTSVTKTEFDEDNHVWTIFLGDGSKIVTRYIFSCTGPLSQPKSPEIKGLKEFTGKVMHPARWDHDYDIKNKNVAVVGTGATSVQLVPTIAPDVARLDVYQRTPIWILPKPDRPISSREKFAFNHIPGAQSAVRMFTNIMTEMIMVIGIIYNKQFPQIIRYAEKTCHKHLKAQIKTPELRQKLTPGYGFGCKRPSISNKYFPAFNRDNVNLITDGIERITTNGIVTADGTARDVDCLITATGYKTMVKGNLPTYEAYGVGGLELGSFWEESRYQAYEGITVPRFPNYFTISFGPRSVSGASWFSIIEAHTTHAIRCVKEASRRNTTSVEVKQDAHDQYYRKVLRREKNNVMFNNDCAGANSYYFDDKGDAAYLRPSSGLEMWWQSRHFPFKHYQFK
ncbi:Baeyer-Villiger monooxygenase [Halioglobus japonicus]|nr:Baeyer-Villiger monooxygenase [Halioglobus japonicus]